MDINKYNPKGKIDKKHFISLSDYQTEDIFEILHRARAFKFSSKAREKSDILKNKNFAFIFAYPSTLTKLSFEMAVTSLGASYYTFSPEDVNLSSEETLKDSIKILEKSNIDGIIATGEHDKLRNISSYAELSVINGVSEKFYPAQVLADLLTLWEKKGTLSNLKLAYVGNPRNIASSLILGCVKTGIKITIACPSGYEPNAKLLEYAEKYGNVEITDNPLDAVKNADAVYTTKLFANFDNPTTEEIEKFAPYRLTDILLSKAKEDAIAMHPLPAVRGEEVDESVLNNSKCVSLEEAGNRVHVAKAILSLLIK